MIIKAAPLALVTQPDVRAPSGAPEDNSFQLMLNHQVNDAGIPRLQDPHKIQTSDDEEKTGPDGAAVMMLQTPLPLPPRPSVVSTDADRLQDENDRSTDPDTLLLQALPCADPSGATLTPETEMSPSCLQAVSSPSVSQPARVTSGDPLPAFPTADNSLAEGGGAEAPSLQALVIHDNDASSDTHGLSAPLFLSRRKHSASTTDESLGAAGQADIAKPVNGSPLADNRPGRPDDAASLPAEGAQTLVLPDPISSGQGLPQHAEIRVDHQPAYLPENSAMRSPANLVLTQPVGTPAWGDSLSQHILFCTRNGMQNAQLQLHPRDLGVVEINLRVHNNQVQMHFMSDNQMVRAAVEAAVPGLRTGLAESGLQLGQSSVGAETASFSFFSQSGQQEPGHKEPVQSDRVAVSESPENYEMQNKIVRYPGRINTFA